MKTQKRDIVFKKSSVLKLDDNKIKKVIGLLLSSLFKPSSIIVVAK